MRGSSSFYNLDGLKPVNKTAVGSFYRGKNGVRNKGAEPKKSV